MTVEELIEIRTKKFLKLSSKLFAEKELNVSIPHSVNWCYDLVYPIDNLGVYIPPPIKYADSKYEVKEAIFLPITSNEFCISRLSQRSHVGYQFTFITTEETKLQLLDDSEHAMASMKVQFNLNRLTFKVKGKDTISLQKIHDPLIPPMVYSIDSSARDIYRIRGNWIIEEVAKHCVHFATSDI